MSPVKEPLRQRRLHLSGFAGQQSTEPYLEEATTFCTHSGTGCRHHIWHRARPELQVIAVREIGCSRYLKTVKKLLSCSRLHPVRSRSSAGIRRDVGRVEKGRWAYRAQEGDGFSKRYIERH